MEAQALERERDTAGPDPKAVEEFGGKVLGILNDAMLGLLVSVGHRTGLFDVMSKLPPSTSGAIARAAGLEERYVREWLSGLVTGQIVGYEPDPGTYHLPKEHAALLTRAAGPDNLAMVFQYVPLLGNVEDEIVECFRNGGGVPYSSFPKFQALQAEESARVFDASLVQRTLPLDPELVDRLRTGIDVCDVGCGHGHAVCLMARAFPKSRFVGYDLSEEAVAEASAKARASGLDNVTFEVRDIAKLEGSPRFDLVTAFDCIHDLAHPARVLEGIASSLRPGGTFLMVDIAGNSELSNNLDHPLATTLYTISCLHCMTVSLAQDGAGLGTMWGEQKARQMLTDAGFTRVRDHKVPEDVLNVYYFARRS